MMNIDPLAIRQSRDWSQQQMAEYVGVKQSTVSRWENGRLSVSGPALKLLQLLAEGVEWPDGIARPCVGGDDSQSEGKIGRKV